MKHFISSLSVLCANTPPCEGRVSSRKILSLLLILFLGVTNAWAETASITFSEKGLTNGVQYLEPFTIDANTTITFAGGDNDGKYYTTGSGMRTYGGGTVTIACANGIISEISFTWSGTNNTYKPTDDVATPAGYSTSTGKWTGSASSVTLTRPSGSGHWRLQKVTVTYETAGGSEPETPAIELKDAQFAWSAATAEATMGASNTFPTLTNTLPVSVTYESSNTAAATIAADGTITLVAPGTTTISAKFAGGEVSSTTYAAKTVKYDLTVLKAPATPTENVYVKVTETAGITDGEYLIVYEDASNATPAPVAFNGALATLDAAKNTVAVAIDGSTIAGNTDIDAALFTIDVTAGTLKSASGKYIGVSSNSNGLKTEDVAKDYKNAFSVDNGNAVIAADFEGSTMSLRYNKTNDANSLRFRYYKNAGQQPIALYKKASSHTVTIASCENGSVSADVASGAKVLSGTTITLSNTPATNYKLTAYDVYKTGDATTKVTVTDGKFIMPEFDVTISATFVPAKTLTSIEITSAATQTTFWQGETFNYTGLEVTAHFDGAADEVVTPTVTGSTATAGTQTVTVSFTEGTVTKTATYTITVKAIPNTKETAYSVADAYDIIDKLGTASGVFISGIISQVDSYNSTYKSITYWISADGTTTKQLQVYSGKGLESADFTAVTDVAKGAQVIVCGNLKKHNTTYEFDYNNYLAAYTAPTKAEPGITYATTEYTANVNETFTAPTLTNPNGLTVAYSTSDVTLATVDAATGAVTIGNKTGKVTITATFAGNETYLYGTASYNITISDPSLVEATFDATVDLGNTERGEGEITKSPITFACTDGVLGNASEYRLYQNATISFTAENGYAITKVVITSTASGTSQYGPGLLSTENGTYSVSDKTGTWVGEAQTVTFTATAQSRAKLITVYYKTDNRQDAGLAWSTENVSITLGDAFTAPTLSNPNGLTLTCTSDNENLATVTNAGVVTLKSGVTGKATITAKFDGNSNYKDATVTCTITVNPKTEIVVILAQYNGQWYALKNVEETAGKVLAALEVTYFNGTLYNVADADKATIEWQRAAVTDGIIFKNGENYIYGTAGSTDLKLSTTECTWTLVGTTYMLGDRTFLYRAQANGFKNYNAEDNAGTADYSALPVVTAPVYTTGTLYTIKATAENGTVVGAGVYVAGDKVTLTADPAMDYTFVNWTKGGEVVSTANPFVFEATEDLELVANFAEISQTSNTLSGTFSVGEYEVAQFATGNLQYNVKNKEWSFAKQQYQYIGDANINVGDPTFTGTIDMFGWSTNETTYGVDPRNLNELYDGEFVDWGNLFPVEDNWSTLSADQWKYLLNERTNASSLKQIARVGSVVGIMLFPDVWNAPLTVTAQPDSYFEVDIHNYTLDQWAALENAGALFLPAAGRRTGGYGNMINYDQQVETNPENLNGGHYKHQDNTNIYCYYWTSTINEDKNVSYLHNIQALGGDKYTINTGAVWGEKGRYGQSVRLAKVTDIPVVIRKELTVGQLGTVCLPYNIPSGQVYGATFYTLEGKMDNKVVFDEVTGELAAGVPYLFQATATEVTCFPGTTIVSDPINTGAMKGTFVDLTLTELSNIYYFAGRALWSCVDLTSLSVPANRAYVNMAEVTTITGAAPVGVRRITLGVNGAQVATGVDQVQGDEVQSIKVLINGQMFIYHNGNMYDAQGKLVK